MLLQFVLVYYTIDKVVQSIARSAIVQRLLLLFHPPHLLQRRIFLIRIADHPPGPVLLVVGIEREDGLQVKIVFN